MIFIVILVMFAVSSAHEITRLLVPLTADPRRAAELSCHFRMDGQNLHSVKWYRGMDEIFRYNPSQKPPIRLFNVSEVMVQEGACQEDVCMVRLMPPPVATTAVYTCEVSTEGPKFQIARSSKQMTVVSIPERDPVITGVTGLVKPGEQMLVNCTSDYSLPHSDIRWYIDDQLQKPEEWQRTELSPALQGGLRASWRVLRVRIHPGASGALRLRCESVLPLTPPVVRETTAIITIHSKAELSKFISNNSGTMKLSVVLVFFVVVIQDSCSKIRNL